MKVILSRKGFDSKYGGIPSFILEDGAMLPLPIPNIDKNDSCRPKNKDLFSKVFLPNGMSVSEAIAEFRPDRTPLCSELKDRKLADFPCHLDPDLYAGARPDRLKGWRGCFGQEGPSLTHLRNNGVGPGDLFLFFGWFCETEHYSKQRGRHVLFGYLQVDRCFDLPLAIKDRQQLVPEWAANHPHVNSDRHKENNALFIARETLSFAPELPGWGLFNYSDDLDLTASGMSRSKWKVIEAFKGNEPTHHSSASWKPNAESPRYFQSAAIGQEFIFRDTDSEGNPIDDSAVCEWAENIIRNHHR